jgi:hypothetical protein
MVSVASLTAEIVLLFGLAESICGVALKNWAMKIAGFVTGIGGLAIYYISGAITHDPHAALKFSLAEAVVKKRGHYCVNPMKCNPAGMPWDEAIVNCIGELNRLGEFYRASLHFLPIVTGLPLAGLLLIDPIGREIESDGVKLEKGIALANGLPVVQMFGDWKNILKSAIEESEHAFD